MNLPKLTREVAASAPYAPDDPDFDTWETDAETTLKGRGDCDASAIRAAVRLYLRVLRGGEAGWLAKFIAGTVPEKNPNGTLTGKLLGHAWCWFRSHNGEEWWADPTFGGDGRCSQTLWPGYEPRWAYDFSEDGQLVNPQEVRRKEQ